MSHLAIFLFGGFRAELDGRPITAFGTDKNRALLAYLALESGRPHRRESLAALLWPNRPKGEARNSLRQALYTLLHVIGKGSETEPHLLITAKQVQFNPASDHWIDVVECKSRLSACQSHHPAGQGLCSTCLESLQDAIELYLGEMLEGFTFTDCANFTDWQTFNQETCHRQALTALTLLADYYETNRAYEQLIACTQRKIELEPWRESAHRRLMWALAMNGQRQQALRQYETLQGILQRELGIPVMDESRRLYEQIRAGHLPGPGALQGEPWQPFPSAGQLSVKAPAPFVARQPELAQLHRYLSDSLAGQGRMAFISGEAGSGKTALLNEFARQAMRVHEDLLVAGGTCGAYNGLGDPYQSFREVLGTLAGISDAPGAGVAISTEQAWRLSAALPAVLQSLIEVSPGLIGTLLPVHTLLQRAQKADGLDAATQAGLAALAAHPGTEQPTALMPSFLKQTGLFHLVARLLLALSRRFPLLILLDDLHWSDSATASLLFYLGSHLSGGRILLLGAYRPEDIASADNPKRHPLVAVLNELQRHFGEILVDLSRVDGRAYVHAYLDSEPNHFDQDFRETLYRHTLGNALFTTELLRAMQERGEIVQDKTGHWLQGPHVDWEQLPARVEAVIAERVGRLNHDCLSLLESASVQGELFNAEVLAQVLGKPEAEVTTRLSGPLCKQQRLVSSLGPAGEDNDRLVRYQFRHLLYQKYLYQGLDDVERRRLHRATAESLERSYIAQEERPGGAAASAASLAWHFEQAGQPGKAVKYYLKAGQEANRLSGFQPAMMNLERGLVLLKELAYTRDRAYLELAYLFELNRAMASSGTPTAPERMPVLQRSLELCLALELFPEQIQVLFMQWSYHNLRGENHRCLDLAQLMLALAEKLKNSRLFGLSAFALGSSLTFQGAFHQAADALADSLVLLEAGQSHSFDKLMEDSTFHIYRLMMYAISTWCLGFPDRALKIARGEQEVSGNQDQPINPGVNLVNAWIHLLRRETAESRPHIQVLQELMQRSGQPVLRVVHDYLDGWEKGESGLFTEAARTLASLVEYMESMNYLMYLPGIYGRLSQAYAGTGDLGKAQYAIRRALELVQNTGQCLSQAELVRIQGENLALQGDHSAAEAAFQAALQIARHQEAKSWELRAAASLARLWKQQGKESEAKQLLAGVYGWFSEGFGTPDLQEASFLGNCPISGGFYKNQ